VSAALRDRQPNTDATERPDGQLAGQPAAGFALADDYELLLAPAIWRPFLVVAGLIAVGLGFIGIVVPGMPATVFFIIAAYCFSRSNRALLRWVLGLPLVGQLILDYRRGLGMPRRAKQIAITMIVLAVSFSVWRIHTVPIKFLVAGLGLVGVWYIINKVPTRELVIKTLEKPT
jgi:uncharacterized protein